METQLTTSRARLVVQGKGAPEVFVLDGRPFTVGRSPECSVVVGDPKVSRLHLRIEAAGEGFAFSDLGSQNGTLRNGKRSRGGPLLPGDILQVGATRLVFEPREDLTNTQVGTSPGTVAGATSVSEVVAAPPADVLMTRFRRLGEIARALSAESDAAVLFDRIIDAAVELTGSERGFLIEVRKEGMEFAAARNVQREDLKKPEFELSWSIAIQAGTRGESVLAVNAATDPRFATNESVEHLGLRSVLCVPVRGASRILGVIYVDNRIQQGVYQPHDRELLELLAHHAGVALMNRHLSQEIAAKTKDLESLQQALSTGEGASRLPDSNIEDPSRRGGEEKVLIGGSARMDELRHLLQKVAATDFPVLVFGESGTGKELVARCLHRRSSRTKKPFVSINCAAIPETLLENELFGHMRGAYTGAEQSKKGLFEAADGGTIFLDEVSEMSTAMQSRLLRVLQEGEVRPIGGKETIKVDVRVIAASNRDLSQMVQKGLFREDLYYRLRVLPVNLPPLRERREDIPELLAHFFRMHSERGAPVIDPAALDVLCCYGWPGNVRELENEVKRLVVLAGSRVEVSSLSRSIVEAGEMLVGKDSGFEDLNVLIESIESREIKKALSKSSGNKTKAAELLGITRFTLQRKLEKYGMSADDV